jgi:VanZ family protein
MRRDLSNRRPSVSRSRWIAPALWGAFIEVLTSWPRVPDFGEPAGSDKLAHVALYGIFAFLVIRAAQQGRPAMRAILISFVALSAWGALDEWHQKFIDGRSADVSDWAADTTGVLVGLAIGWAKPRQISTGIA